jgi:hypothetical protein
MSTRTSLGVALFLGAALFCSTPAFAATAGEGDGASTTPASAVATDGPEVEKVCDGLDSTKIDTDGAGPTLEISAPEGFVITEYCVKAGSVQQGNGPEYVTVEPPTRTVIIAHSSGKGISHYSYSYEPEPTTPPTTPPATTPPASTPPATTPATASSSTPPAGAGLAETGFDTTWLLIAGVGAAALGSLVVGERFFARRRSTGK